MESTARVVRPRWRSWLGIGALAAGCVLVAAVGIVAARCSGLFDAEPGEPGWRPLVSTGAHGAQHGTAPDGQYRLTYAVTVRGQVHVPVTVESVRAVFPRGFVLREVGFTEHPPLGVDAGQPLDRAPLVVEPHSEHELVLRFQVECVPAGQVEDVLPQVHFLVRQGAVRQEVQLPDPPELTGFHPDAALPTCQR